MPTPSTLTLFAGIALLFAASPGPNFIFVLSRSLSYGRKEGFFSVLGIGLGALVHTAAAVLGISALLETSALAFSVVKYAGAAYLIYLGLKTLLQKSVEAEPETARAPSSPWQAVRQGFVTMILNPKAALYYFSFLPQFVDSSLGTATLQLAVFGLMQGMAAVSVYALVALFAGSVGKLFKRHSGFRAAQRTLTGIIYLLLGASIAVSGRK